MKNVNLKTLIITAALFAAPLVAAEKDPQWRIPEWRLKAELYNADLYWVACSKDSKNLLTKACGNYMEGDLTTEWDFATLATITQERCSHEWGVVFDEKGNAAPEIKWPHAYVNNRVIMAAKKALSAVIDEDDIIQAATFSPDGKQLVTVFEDKMLPGFSIIMRSKIWELIKTKTEQAQPALESKATEK